MTTLHLMRPERAARLRPHPTCGILYVESPTLSAPDLSDWHLGAAVTADLAGPLDRSTLLRFAAAVIGLDKEDAIIVGDEWSAQAIFRAMANAGIGSPQVWDELAGSSDPTSSVALAEFRAELISGAKQ